MQKIKAKLIAIKDVRFHCVFFRNGTPIGSILSVNVYCETVDPLHQRHHDFDVFYEMRLPSLPVNRVVHNFTYFIQLLISKLSIALSFNNHKFHVQTSIIMNDGLREV